MASKAAETAELAVVESEAESDAVEPDDCEPETAAELGAALVAADEPVVPEAVLFADELQPVTTSASPLATTTAENSLYRRDDFPRVFI
jgi:hypothetical protein